MEYADIIHNARYYFPVVTALFFVIKLVGGMSRDRKHSLILCSICALYFMMPDIDDTLSRELYKKAYIEALFIVILISGAGMMAMFSAAVFDKKAFKHALILTFIIFINFMLTWHYTESPQPFFHGYFDELIITASILQIMVSYDGFTESVTRIIGFFRASQSSVVGVFVSCVRCLRNTQIHKKSERRS